MKSELSKIMVGAHYEIECLDKDGNLKWKEDFDNLVPTVGLNKFLDATLKTGLAAPSWFVGLKNNGVRLYY